MRRKPATLSKMPRQCVLCKPGTGTEFPAQFAGNWLPVPGLAPRDEFRARVSPKTVKHPRRR
jgi:hypothetical protein